jgi:photosystem II stability/assembly factor-like uncharacterized protein
MKRLFLVSFIHLFISVFSFGQNRWQWLNPQPSGYGCIKIVFTDRQNGLILNNNGDLLKTTDQGNSWNIFQNFPRASCMSIADSTAVIACFTGAIYISSDNGNSWDSSHLVSNDQLQFANVVSRDSFFVSTGSGLIYSTGDRGKTWTSLNANAQINCISFVNSMIGFAGSNNSGILKTTDGGKTWNESQQVNYGPSSILAIQFLNADTGYASREYFDLLVTHDGGLSWQVYNGHETMYAIDFFNSDIGYLGGEDGALYRSTDGGINWASVSPPGGFRDNFDINSMYFISAGTGFAVGNLGRIIKTTDSGQTWNSYSPTYTPITSVSFGSASTGYATNWNNIFKTTDSGLTWIPLSLTTGTDYGSSSIFKYAHFTSADTGYVISSEYVTAHKTTDGGQTWTSVVPTGYGYEDVPGACYPDSGTDILSLGTAQVETKDLGATWNTLWTAQFYGQSFTNIFYLSKTIAFAINNSQLYKTTDGFQTWNSVLTNALGYSFTSIWFVNPQKGFVTDDESQIFVTNDGGNTWEQVPFTGSFIGDTFNSTIRFFNEQVGFVTTGNSFGPGSYGGTYKTVDGGKTWQLSYPIGGSSIEFTSDSNVIIAGYGGTILKSPVMGWQLDSFSIQPNYACGEIMTASIGISLGEIDSIQFVVSRAGNIIKTMNFNPGNLKNDRISFSTVATGLTQGTDYTVSIRFLYNGIFIYRDTLEFIAQGLPAPFFYDSSGVLISSAASGNQWFLNGTAIADSTNQRLTPKITGTYTVQIKQDSCISPMSSPQKFISNDLGVQVNPNPVKDYLYLSNTQNRTLILNIKDMTGRTVTQNIVYTGFPVYVNNLSPGVYIVHMQDENNKQTANILFLKL